MKNPLPIQIPLIDRLNLEKAFGGYTTPGALPSIGNVNYTNVSLPPVNQPTVLAPNTDKPASLEDLESFLTTPSNNNGGMLTGGSINRSLAESYNPRFPNYVPGDYDNEDAYGQNQGWTTKMFNGVTKGLALTGTTFLQTTAGLINGVIQARADGRWASFYDNEFNRALDDFNKDLENTLPTYETKKFRDAKWYSPDYLFTGNFLWEGIVKNLGFAGGAALSGNVFAGGLRAFSQLPGIARVASTGRIAQAISQSEAGITGVSNLGKVKSMSDNFLGAYSALNKGQRVLVAGLSTTGEAGIEAYHNLNDWRDQAIQNFKKNYGREPNSSELEVINKTADSVGNATFIGNMALLSATNYIQFPKILGSSYKAEKGILNEFASKTNKIVKEGDKYIAKKPSVFGRVSKAVTNPYVFSYSEAFEEGSQFAIGKATEDYYSKKYAGEDHDWFDSILEGYKETLTTDEGMKNILIGGLSGALMLAKGKIKESSDTKKNTSAALSSQKWSNAGLNSAKLSDFMSDTYDSVVRGTEIQQAREGYINDGDILNSKDAEADYIINYLAPRIKHGRFDLVKADINDYKQLASTEEGFSQLQKDGIAQETDTSQAFLERLSNFEQTADNVKSLYQSLNVRYKGYVNEEGNRIYTDDVIDKMVYAASKIADYDQRYEQLSSDLINNTINLDEIATATISKDDSLINSALEKIKNDPKMNATQKEEVADKLKDAVQIAVRRDNFLKEYDAIKTNPNKFREKTAEDITDVEDKKEITVKTGKNPEKTVITGEPYYLVENVNFRKDGIKPVRKAHKVRLLKQNPDGSVEIEFENGVVKTVTPEQLSEYNLGKVDVTDANAKAKFVLENLDQEYVHYGINQYGKKKKKDEEPAKGVLQYNTKDDIVEFVWQTPSGKTYTREVTNTMFKAKKDSNYTGGMVRRTGSTISENARKAEENFLNSKLSISEKLARRTSVAENLYSELLSQIKGIKTQIESNNKKLNSLDEEIANAYKTKNGKPRKRITKKILETVETLEKLKETLPQENERLQEQQILLEGELDAVKEFVDSIELMSNTGTQMINDIKQEMEDVKSLIGLTKDAIKRTEEALPLVEALYQKALKLLNDFVERTVSLNPGLPLTIEGYRENIERFLGAENADGIISRGEGFTNQVLDIENTILSYSEELNFPKHEAKFLKLSEDLQELKDNLPSLEANYRAQEKILQAFRDFYKEQKTLEKQEQVLKDNGKLQKQMDVSLEKGGEVAMYDPEFKPNPRKATKILPNASIGIQDGKSHQDRANKFGFNLAKMQAEGKNIKAVYVTKKTEAQLGLEGLMDKLRTDEQGNLMEGVNPDTIIATVMVTVSPDGVMFLVDETGDPITDEFNILNKAIYQVMPLESLSNSQGSMFREDVSEDVQNQVKKQYKEWREEVLSRENVEGVYTPKASFGILEFEENQRTSVVSAGLIDNNNVLLNKRVINISTTQDVLEKGTTSYPNPYKRVLLETDEGYVQLQNKQHTEEEAVTLYRMIVGLANELVNDKDGLKSGKGARLLDAIKGRVYWGLPTDQKGRIKKPGYSSIYFQTEPGADFPTLFVGNKGKRFIFTPTGLKKNSGEIIEAIQELYTNTQYFKLTSKYFDEKYEEIISMSEDGEIVESRLWPNYQSYLLSETLPSEDGSKLTNKKRDSIPLTTVANPITDTKPENRHSIYFYNAEAAEDFTVEETKKTNLKRDKVISTQEVSDADVISLVESLSPEYREFLAGKTDPAEKAKNAKGVFVQVALRTIISEQEGIRSIKNEEERKTAILKDVQDFNERTKDVPLDKRVTTLWAPYQELVNQPMPSEEELMNGFGEMTFNNTEEQTPPTPPVVSSENTSETDSSEEVQIITYKNNTYSVDMTQGTITNTNNGNVIDSTSTTGAAILNLVEWDNNSEEQKPPASVSSVPSVNRKRRKGRKRDYRKRLKNKRNIYSVEDWAKVATWLKNNFPNIPVYRLENIIKNTNGDQAWGMFEDGAIYVYKNAEGGTVYHEVFEAVWRMFTDENEQANVIEEFKSREGNFVDRPSGKTVSYKDATDQQIKEELAEEFRKFVNRQGLPPKGLKGYIQKLFRDLKNFINNIFIKRSSNIQDLFDKINTGYYKNNMPYTRELSFASKGIIDSDEVIITDDADFSKLPGLTDLQTNDVVEELIYNTLNRMVSSDVGLFSLDPVKVSTEILKKDIRETIQILRESVAEDEDISVDEKQMELVQLYQLQKNIMDNFDEIKKLFNSRIQSYGIQLDENDVAQINSEEKTRNSDYVDATKVDKFKKMNAALKLLFNTVAKVDEDGYDVMSSIGGVQTLTFGQVSNTLMKELHKSRNIEEMQEAFRKLAEKDPNYRRLYRRFFNTSFEEKGVGLKNINTVQKFRMVSGLWKTFSLHAPEVKNVFILDNGDIEVGDANLSTEAAQLRNDFLNKIILRSKSGTGFFKNKPKEGLFVLNKDKLDKYPLRANKTSYYNFLDELGIDFTVQEMNKLNKNQFDTFKEVVGGIRKSINDIKSIRTFSSTTLDLHGRLLTLALLKAAATNNTYESTYFNVSGERTQTFIGSNAPGRLFKHLSQIENINELIGTEFEYLIPGNDVFSEGSVLLSKMFDLETGNRRVIFKEDKLMSVGYAGGIINEARGKNTQSSKLKLRDRFLQEINLNLKGWYLNLVPGDSSTEWMTYMDNHISEASLNRGFDDVHNIFKNYFISEVNLSRENRKVSKRRKSDELRFFKDILEASTLASISRSNKPAEELYAKHEEAIKRAVENQINNNTSKLKSLLIKFNAIQNEFGQKGKFRIENVNVKNVNETQLNNILTMLTVNYMINNIEQHKLLYGDPYQYKDELKRTKSFQSPRQEILNSSTEMNSLIDKIWNKKFLDNPYGRTNFIRDHFNTVTLSDIEVVNDFKDYGVMEETDGGGIISMKALRNFKIRSSDWTEANEKQFAYEVEWEKIHKEGLVKIAQGKLTKEELFETLSKLKNPKVRDTFTAIKPVVTGNRVLSNTYNETVLDKYSLYPVSYRMSIEMNAKNAMKLHNKMQKEDIDYVIFNTGRKVGAYSSFNSYNEDGSFNTDPYPADTIIHIPFSTMGLQTEVPSKDDGKTTRGSQVTKIITMDRMDAGVPIDYMPEETSFMKRFKAWSELSEDQKVEESDLYAEIKLNKELLEEQIQFGYDSLLKKLGIVEKNGRFEIKDFETTVNLIKNEVLLRETNDNIIEALDTFMKGTSVLEATPAYKQISNILYSIVDKNIVHPKISGGMKVQIPSTFWEENRLAIQEINGKKGYTSDALGFYSLEENGRSIEVMEIMVGRWFKAPNMTDEELLEYLNNTKKGQEILKGFAFRIPTQNMNSVDAFKIKKFLPEEFGDNVVVPSAIVGKVGSDFDIDKLSMYLKNVYTNIKGKPQAVPDWGIGPEARERAKEAARAYLIEELDWNKAKIESKDRTRSLFADIALGNKIGRKKTLKWFNILKEWFKEDLVVVPENVNDEGDLSYNESGQVELGLKLSFPAIENFFMQALEKHNKRVEELTDEEIFEELVDKLGDKLYKQGLQNAYIDSNIRLLTHPTNFKKLTSPNSAKEMQDLAKKIHRKLGNEDVVYSNPINFLDRTFMTDLRHNFVAGKGGIGIAAVGQTNHANNQHQLITVDKSKIKLAPKDEQIYLGDGEIRFKKYNSVIKKGKKVPTLSMRLNQAGQYISDIMGMFVDGYVDISNGPWIMQMGATPETTATWQFLVKLGVPLIDVAFFMNQPIIKDYLQMLENKGYSWLFIDTYAKELKLDKYGTDHTLQMSSIPSATTLFKTIGATKLDAMQKAQQQFYLDEFLKYAMMARHSYYFTQGTNYDTASFNNPYLLFKKEEQLKVARNSIIDSADSMLNQTFLGRVRSALGKARESLAKVLISDKPRTREVVQTALKPYIHLPNRDFVKMAERVVTNLFDWAVQTHTGINDEISEILIEKGNIVQRLNRLIKDVKADPEHPLYGNYVLELAEVMPSKKAEEGSTDNLKIKTRNSEVYDQNRMIYAFRELKEFLKDESDLYTGIVKLAILQSGLSSSNISFTSLLPFDDFKDFYNEALTLLEDRMDLNMFNELNVFQRNNWNNSDIVGYERADWIPLDTGNVYNPGMKFLSKNVKEAIGRGEIPQIMTMLISGASRGTHVVYTWEDQIEDLLTPEELTQLNKTGGNKIEYFKKKKQAMKEAGDFSFMHKALMQRVNKPDGTPYISERANKKGEMRSYYVYKPINAWGNGTRANEFYDSGVQSQINNNFEVVDEVSDAKVLEVFESKLKKPASKYRTAGRNSDTSRPDHTMTLKGKVYKFSEIDSNLLVSLGYNEEEAGNILKIVCK